MMRVKASEVAGAIFELYIRMVSTIIFTILLLTGKQNHPQHKKVL